MFNKCLNRKCDIVVAFSGCNAIDAGSQPAIYTGLVKANEDDYIEMIIEYADAVVNRKVKNQNYTLFIKKEYIISIMIVE